MGSTSSRIACAAVSSSEPSQFGPCSSCVCVFGFGGLVSEGIGGGVCREI